MTKILTALIILLLIITISNCTKSEYILAVGDSHGAHKNGWVDQLKKLHSNDTIINVSISGNTIGFDNLNRDTLNTSTIIIFRQH